MVVTIVQKSAVGGADGGRAALLPLALLDRARAAGSYSRCRSFCSACVVQQRYVKFCSASGADAVVQCPRGRGKRDGRPSAVRMS